MARPLKIIVQSFSPIYHAFITIFSHEFDILLALL